MWNETPEEQRVATPEEQTASTSVKAPKPDKLFGIRHLQISLLFAAMLLDFAMRVNLSVAILEMTDPQNPNLGFPKYDWDTMTIGIVLSSYYWGYIVTQIPAGEVAQKYGPKLPLFGAVFGSSLFAILTPLAAGVGGSTLVCACRVAQGLSQGFMFPSVHTFLSRWSPVPDRGVLSTFVYAGPILGALISVSLCGFLASSSGGWPSCFYVFGSLGIVWSILWLILGANSPAECKYISQEECDFILDSTGVSSSTRPARVTPWREVLTSLPMWAITIANFGSSWSLITLQTELPTYLKTVLHFDINENGLVSALPIVSMFLLSFVFSYIARLVDRKKLLTLTVSRKLFNSIAFFTPAAALVYIAFVTNTTVIVALMIIGIGFSSAFCVGYQVNHLDLAPNFAGTMMGISNGSGTIASILAPLVVAAIVTESGSADQWDTVFYITAAIFFVTNLIFLVFGTAELQYWNDLLPSISERTHLIPKYNEM